MLRTLTKAALTQTVQVIKTDFVNIQTNISKYANRLFIPSPLVGFPLITQKR